MSLRKRYLGLLCKILILATFLRMKLFLKKINFLKRTVDSGAAQSSLCSGGSGNHTSTVLRGPPGGSNVQTRTGNLSTALRVPALDSDTGGCVHWGQVAYLLPALGVWQRLWRR